MLIYVIYFKKGVKQVKLDLEKYNQFIELKKREFEKKGKNIEVEAYMLFRAEVGIGDISRQTGFPISQILEIVGEIDPLLYLKRTKKSNSESSTVKTKTR